ncbi:Chloroplast stem-loop binding protein b, chloroplastic [Amphibalanus amphitrite]|uniref:Chloroplast stem-loop binding protein b, chloroplastic n=1 Tax=Amphibalanus amphitrite TaxID=1232801 RepID=A0A6A4V432_AMPAM|nr:Chloroplast stem-loop binding protein b, chloroplastic [Amphibalanus amphitrite]
MSPKQSVLMVGGNGLMGGETASLLISEGTFDLTLLNRGTVYFDSAQRIDPHVNHICCDRRGSLTELESETTRRGRWDFVIDFCAYRASDVTNLLAALDGRFGHYVYISSDSVYEVSAPSAGGGPSVEEDARRPEDPAERARLAAADPYGDGKLAVEEALEAAGVPYTALRLPDVLGPRDTSRRWWVHQAWLQHAPLVGRPVPVSAAVAGRTTSYVFAPDVARAVRRVMELEIATELGGFKHPLTELTDDPARHGLLPSVDDTLPSVTRGPVSIARARRELGFEPTPWPQVLRETVQFCREAFYRFPEERQHVLQNLKYVAVDDEHRQRLEHAFAELVEDGAMKSM